MKTSLIRLLFFCYVFLILPCCTFLKNQPLLLPFSECSPQQILEELSEKDSVQGLRGVARIKGETPGEKFSVKEIIVAQRPSSLRLETLSPLGHPEFFMITDGRELFFFSPPDNRFYYGIASPKNISLFVPVALGVEEMVSILLGSIPLIEYDAEKIVHRVRGEWCVIELSSQDGHASQVLKIHRALQRVVETEIYDQEGGAILSMRYGNYEEIGGVYFPKEISVAVPRDKTRVKVSYKQLELTSEIDPVEFRLVPPQGVEVIPLE